MAISGKNAVVVIDSGTICARTWSITDDHDILDGTNTCSGGWKEYVSGLQGYTGTIMAHGFVSVAGTTPVAVSISDDLVTFSGSAFVKTDLNGSVDGLEEYTYNLTFTGEVTVS